MITGSVGSSGYQTYMPNTGAGKLQSQAQPVNNQAALESSGEQGGGGTQITALAKANELQKNIIDLIA